MPFFISFEGPDGSGKSTQARRLAASLRERGYPVTETREPGGTPLGDRIRQLVLDSAGPAATPLAMALLMSASRAQLVEEVINPALREGRIVITDRYADSTMAYQSAGHGLDRDVVESLTTIATGGLRPDLVIYVDVTPEVGLQRVRSRGIDNRLDREALDFHRRVRTRYRELIEAEPARWIVIDGFHSPHDVQADIMRAVEPILESVTVER